MFNNEETDILPAGNYISWFAKVAFPRVLEIFEARKSIIKQATQLIHDKQSKSITGKDILSLMITENLKMKGRLGERELVNQVMTFLYAGHETTATAVFLFYCSFLRVGNVGIISSCSTF